MTLTMSLMDLSGITKQRRDGQTIRTGLQIPGDLEQDGLEVVPQAIEVVHGHRTRREVSDDAIDFPVPFTGLC